MRRTVAAAEAWEADVVPLPGSLDEDPTSRPGVVLVMAAGLEVHGDSLDRPSPEPEALAATLEAAFYRAAPWSVHANLDALEATTPAGHTWTACILGQGGEEYGLALFSEPAEFWQLAAAPGRAGERLDDLDGCVVSVIDGPGCRLRGRGRAPGRGRPRRPEW